MSEEKETRLEWSTPKFITTCALFAGGFLCVGLGISPFVSGEAELKDLANIGFMILILFFMGAFFKVRKNSRFIFWSACFLLILYADAMFMFYETLFS